MLKYLLAIGAIFFIVIWTTKQFWIEPHWENNETAQDCSFELIPELVATTDTLNYSKHYKNISQHFKKPFFQNTSYGLLYRDDEAMLQYYSQYSSNRDEKIFNLGRLCKAVIYNRLGQTQFAATELKDITNKNIPGYELEMAIINSRYGDFMNCETVLEKELVKHPNDEFVLSRLAWCYNYQFKFKKLASLYTPERDELLYRYKAKITLLNGELFSFFKLNLTWANTSAFNSLTAFFIGILWLIYAIKTSLFDKLSLKTIGIIFVLGLICTFFTPLVYQLVEILFHFRKTGSDFHNLLYCIFGIGLIEESVKLIPVLIAIKLFPNQFTAPAHYVVAGITSAIAFSSLENSIYFEAYPGEIIYSRAFLCVAGHIFCTCLTLYGWKVISFPSSTFNMTALFFFCSILFHGFYDAFLMIDSFNEIWFVAYILAAFSAFGLARILNYAINFSPNFNSEKTASLFPMKEFLLVGFSFVLIVEFLGNAYRIGYFDAYDKWVFVLLPFTFFILLWITNLTDIQLLRKFKTGIFSLIDKFKYPELCFKTLQLNLPGGNLIRLNSKEEIVVDKKRGNVLATSDSPYQGFDLFLLKPLHRSLKKKSRNFEGLLFGIVSNQTTSNESISNKDLQKIGKVTFEIENDKDVPSDWIGKLNTGLTFLGLFAILVIMIMYMSFRSSRYYMKHAALFLEEKTLSYAGGNSDYAMQVDQDYAEPIVTNMKIYTHIHQPKEVIPLYFLLKPIHSRMKKGADYMVAKAFLATQDTLSAKKYFTLLASEPDDINDSTFYFLGILEYKHKNSVSALKWLSLFEKNHPVPSSSLVEIKAQCHYELGQFEQAKWELEKLKTMHYNKNGAYFSMLGECYWNTQDTVQACRNWNEGVKLDHPDCHDKAGRWCVSVTIDSLAQ